MDNIRHEERFVFSYKDSYITYIDNSGGND